MYVVYLTKRLGYCMHDHFNAYLVQKKLSICKPFYRAYSARKLQKHSFHKREIKVQKSVGVCVNILLLVSNGYGSNLNIFLALLLFDSELHIFLKTQKIDFLKS